MKSTPELEEAKSRLTELIKNNSLGIYIENIEGRIIKTREHIELLESQVKGKVENILDNNIDKNV